MATNVLGLAGAPHVRLCCYSGLRSDAAEDTGALLTIRLDLSMTACSHAHQPWSASAGRDRGCPLHEPFQWKSDL